MADSKILIVISLEKPISFDSARDIEMKCVKFAKVILLSPAFVFWREAASRYFLPLRMSVHPFYATFVPRNHLFSKILKSFI